MTPQVSHGLNLILHLDPAHGPFRATMAKVLSRVLQRTPQIHDSFDGLGFVYFARFLPTPDNAALLVIAEFDLPPGTALSDRVLALANRIGFLFDDVLQWVLDAPATPVASNQRAFAAFVARNNRVQVECADIVRLVTSHVVPDLADYPLYSAYPRKPVGAIVPPAAGAPAGGVAVSHGLNLVLALETPVAMTALLGALLDARPEIEAALDRLGFVHFARFLPTPDHSALLVITEFDGPLEPYVMDFAIAIGDVFTTVLGFVRDAPPLPVTDHPDEFWRFIQENNRVAFDAPALHALLPNDVALPDPLDYPMYRAFPQRTVLDIVGPRAAADLPQPVGDRASGVVDFDDVQGNILRGFHADVACHFVLTVADRMAARAWLAQLAGGPVGGVPGLTSAVDRGTPPDRTQMMLTVGFTIDGLAALGISSADLGRFPAAFKEGPADSARAAANGDVGDSAPANWLLGNPGRKPHLMLSLYAFSPAGDAAFAAAQAAIRAALAQAGLVAMTAYPEYAAKALDGDAIYFGYRDGIAQPRIAGVPSTGKSQDADLQPAASPGEFLLHPDLLNIYQSASIGELPPALATNGTFCVVRLLEQDVKGFEDLLDKGAASLGVDRELIAAKLAGRWRRGQPLSKFDAGSTAIPPGTSDDNDFDYAPSYEYAGTFPDDQGLRCPMGAHIRRANPRSGRVAGVSYSRRLIRRGMPATWATPQGGQALGLFGMFMCGDIARQFEFIQQQWLQGDLFGPGVRGTQDPMLGTASLTGRVSLPGVGTGELAVPRLVTTRGSLYLFMPGLAALRLWHPQADPPMFARRMSFDAPLRAGTVDAVPSTPLQALIKTVMGDVTEGIVDAIVPAKTPQPRPQGLPLSPHAGNFDPLSPGFIANPYPTYAQFRQDSPIHWVDAHGAFWVFDYRNVMTVCTDARFSKDLGEARGLFTMDPPRHDVVRPMMNVIFGQVIANATALAAQVTRDALADIEGPDFHFVDDFARRVPREVLFQLLGLPQDDWLEVDQLARAIMFHQAGTLSAHEQYPGRQAALELSLRIGELLAHSLVGSGSGLLYEIATRTRLWATPTALSVVESVMTVLQFILGGYLSTEFLISTGTRNLLSNDRAGWQAIQANAVPWEQAIDEMRRFEAPLGVIDRYAAQDIDGLIPGFTIPAGTRFMGLLGSANHDPAVFGAQADVFDITRAPSARNIALGWGIHRCIGAPLQAQVMPVAMKMLMERFPNLALVSPLKTPPWFPDLYFRSFSQLDVTS